VLAADVVGHFVTGIVPGSWRPSRAMRVHEMIDLSELSPLRDVGLIGIYLGDRVSSAETWGGPATSSRPALASGRFAAERIARRLPHLEGSGASGEYAAKGSVGR
jgi:hypothetical protein